LYISTTPVLVYVPLIGSYIDPAANLVPL